MATVTNTHRAPLALPNGQVLQPHQATKVAEWDQIKGNHVIQEWVKSGVLRRDLDVELVYRFIRDTVWVAVRWYRPGGKLTHDDVADQYLTILLDGITS